MLHMNYLKRLNQTESPIFRDFVCSLFPKAILFDFCFKQTEHTYREDTIYRNNELNYGANIVYFGFAYLTHLWIFLL